MAVLDVSATCHMPDVLEAPYRPALRDECAGGQAVRLGGPSCLAGDVIGTYGFDALPQAGDRLAFLDQAHYSMVKTTTFNGVPLPHLPFGTATRMLCAWCARLIMPILKDACHEPCM